MGADMLGFNFYPESPRYLTVEQADAIIRQIPTFVDTVGVFVNPTADHSRRLPTNGFLNWIQLHGDETPEFCDMLNWFQHPHHQGHPRPVRRGHSDRTKPIPPTPSCLMRSIPTLYGGTGKTFDWSLIGDINSRRVFLAGGITPENVARRLAIGVYGIDICSGIESSARQKRPHKNETVL